MLLIIKVIATNAERLPLSILALENSDGVTSWVSLSEGSEMLLKRIKNRREERVRRSNIERRTYGAATMALITNFQRRLGGVRRILQRRNNTEKPKVSE